MPWLPGQIRINQPSVLCLPHILLLVRNPSRPCLTPECRFHLNQTLCLSVSLLLVYVPEPNMPFMCFEIQSLPTNP